MHLWLDNTGLHAVGRCLSGRSLGEFDFREFLQIATQLIFSDSILVNEFELNEVSAQTQQVLHQLVTCGLPDDAIKICPTTRKQFRDATLLAANECAKDLNCFNPTETVALQFVSPNLGPQIRQSLEGFHRLITSGRPYRDLNNVRKTALSMKSGGAVDFMYASSPALFEAIQRFRNDCKAWSLARSNELNIFLRWYLLHNLAGTYAHCYSPAVGRAALVRTHHANLITMVNKAIDDVVSERLQLQSLAAPSIVHVLAHRSRGDIKGFVGEVANARKAASNFRAWLNVQMKSTDQKDIILERKRCAIANDVAHSLRRELRIGEATSRLDAIELSLTLGIPSLSVKLDKLLEWYNYLKRRKHLSVLTEYSAEAVFHKLGSNSFERLKRECGTKSNM